MPADVPKPGRGVRKQFATVEEWVEAAPPRIRELLTASSDRYCHDCGGYHDGRYCPVQVIRLAWMVGDVWRDG